MRTIKAKPLTTEAFAQYGSFVNVLRPDGHFLGGDDSKFFNDPVTMAVGGVSSVAFSPLVMKKPKDMIITKAEYHTSTGEGILIMDDDAIVHVAPPTSHTPVPEKTEAFIVPKGTFLKLNTAVWHLGPLPVNNNELHVLIVLPERIYANDCVVVDYKEEEYIKIEL